MERRNRPTARVIVVDEVGRVLLLHVDDPVTKDPPLWIIPGGGLNHGETFAEAAARELAEETGLVVSPQSLGEPIAVGKSNWEFRGVPIYSEISYYALTTQAFELDDSGWDETEREFHIGWRWWTVDEINVADERIIPTQLAEILRQLEDGPIDIPIELLDD